MSDPTDRRGGRERANPAPEPEPQRAPSPLADFLDDADAALSELREAESPRLPARERAE